MDKKKAGTITFEDEAECKTKAEKALAKVRQHEIETADEFHWVLCANKTWKRKRKNENK